jgi:tRNA(Ser,Leu) C12 N-acetylase TAN1
MAKLVVTALGLYEGDLATRALKDVLPDIRVRSTGFRGVLLAEVNGDPVQIAKHLSQKISSDIGRIVPVIEEAKSEYQSIAQTAITTALEHIDKKDSYCFRIHKRGRHELTRTTPEIEETIGREIHLALEAKFGEKPRVDLENPDVSIHAEVLGRRTMVGITRKNWFR